MSILGLRELKLNKSIDQIEARNIESKKYYFKIQTDRLF